MDARRRDVGAFYYRYSEHIFTALHVHGHRRAVATSRLGASIAAYFILNFGLQMLTVAGMLVSGVVLAATGAMDALVPMVEHAAPAAVMCAVMGAVGAVLLVGCVIYFCITRWLLTKRLNLA